MKKIIYTILSLVLICSLLGLPGIGCRPEVTPEVIGGELNLYDSIGPLTLDPAVSGEMTSHSYIMQLFSGLLRLDDNSEPAPDIAKQWHISDDGRTYTFYLRQGVKFHNNREVTAEDFKYSWERACAPETHSLTASTYLGDIVGAKEMLAGQAEEISGVRVINDYTLEVTIDAPKSYFLFKLTYPTTFVVDEANVASGSLWWRQPNGTGPFKLKQWDENRLLVLERNDLYYDEIAKVDSVIFHLLAGIPLNLYETGEIDVTNVSLSYIDKVSDKANPFSKELQIVPELSFSYIGFNTTKPPFDDINIRRAFSQAIDKDKLASLVYRDMVQPAAGILPPGIPGFNKDLSGLTFNTDKARELIKASRYGDISKLPPITITTTGWGGLISQALEAIVYEWRHNLGVEVEVRQLEPDRFLYHLKQERDEMYYTGWVADYPHPQNFLEVLFHSDSEHNYGEYSNSEIDTLLEKAGVEQNNKRSLALYQQAEQKLVDDAACLPLWFGKNYILIKPYVKGYNLNIQGLAMLNSVSIEPH